MSSSQSSRPPVAYPRVAQYLMLLIFLVLAVLFLSIGVGVIRVLWFSERVPATVVSVEVTPESLPSREVRVAYKFGGADLLAKLRIGPDAVAPKAGDTIQVQVLASQSDRPLLHDPSYPRVLVTFVMGVIALGPCIALAGLIARLYRGRVGLTRVEESGNA